MSLIPVLQRQEVEVLQIWGKFGVHIELQASDSYTEKPWLAKIKGRKKRERNNNNNNNKDKTANIKHKEYLLNID